MQISQIAPIAREIIHATAPLVGGRTINIMDITGLIIASSDPERVGSFHQGAAEAAEKRGPVRIYPEDLSRYPGAREGINLPILQKGQLLGVVGILGYPDQVEDAANLLRVCVELYLEQAAAARKSALRRELRLSLLQRLAVPGGEEADIRETGHALGLELCLPLRAVAISFCGADAKQRMNQLERIEERLVAQGMIDPAREIYGSLGNVLFILKSTPVGFQMMPYMEQLSKAVQAEMGSEPAIAAGAPAHLWRETAASCKEARRLADLRGGGCGDLLEPADRVLYLMGSMDKSALERLVAPMYDAVRADCGADLAWVLETARAYCDCGSSATKAAEQLHIHKNTLLYRVQKILDLMGVPEEQGYYKAWFLQVFLLYHQENQHNEGAYADEKMCHYP